MLSDYSHNALTPLWFFMIIAAAAVIASFI